MQARPECLPCYLVQVLSAMRYAGVSDAEAIKIMAEVAGELKLLRHDRTPNYNSTLVLRKAYELAGVSDPYREAKKSSNRLAEQVLQKIEPAPEEDSLLTALKLSAAGNVIDLGIQSNYDIEKSLKAAIDSFGNKDSYLVFREDLDRAVKVLVIGDNSGEIVFDKVLVKEFLSLGKQVVYAVKLFPILNDATRDDAVETGLADLVPVIDTGNGFLGVEWELCSQEFKKAYNEADLVLAKGQANYESLESQPHAADKTYFLLRAKCPIVAEHLGVNLGDWVLKRNI